MFSILVYVHPSICDTDLVLVVVPENVWSIGGIDLLVDMPLPVLGGRSATSSANMSSNTRCQYWGCRSAIWSA